MRRVTATASGTLLAAALVASFVPAVADDKTLLIELDPRLGALPNAVNPTGTVVVGKFADSGGFYWMPTTGVIDIGSSFVTGVSADGETIVGGDPPRPGIQEAAIWLRATEWRRLGSFPGAKPCDFSQSNANGVSRDGKVVVGGAYDGCAFFHAFRWEESTGIVDLGSSVAGKPSRADAISGDGRVVVGYQDDAEGRRRGARWVDGRQDLFEGPQGPVGIAAAASFDGSIVTGANCLLSVFEDQSAWIWTAGGGVECLPPPALRSVDNGPSLAPKIATRAAGTSDDARVIGGGQTVAGQTEDSEAIVWINRKPVYLKDLLRANGIPNAFDGWVHTGEVRAVSAEGRILVGWGAAPSGFSGYVVVLGSKLVVP
jgi:probable HAF family extracellular repeat protein